jgi:hypothetical protein
MRPAHPRSRRPFGKSHGKSTHRKAAKRINGSARRLRMESLESRLVLSTVPLSELPILHSAPQFSKKIFLDFDGHLDTTSGYNNFQPIHAAAYDHDDDIFSFSESELQLIRDVWQTVADDFAPFQVDVTTEDPSIANPTIYSQSGQAIRAVFSRAIDRAELGGTGNGWHNGAGVAPVGAWYDTIDQPAWIFAFGEGFGESIGNVGSHEIGHTFGLSHDGQIGTGEYYSGHGSGEAGWAPIMGSSGKNLVHWSKGEYYNATLLQDDLAIIAAGAAYRADDHSSVVSLASNPTQLVHVGESLSGAGIIEKSASGSGAGNNDIDVFKFSTGTGDSRLILDIAPPAVGENLDIEAKLYNSLGGLIATYGTTTDVDVHIDVTLGPGTYMLAIDGVGWGSPLSNPPTGYTDYGSLGNYTIKGSLELVGDYNHDLVVDTADYNLWSATFGSTTVLYADGNRNGVVDAADYVVWQAHQGASATLPATLTVSTLVDENDGIYAAGDLSLREALAWAGSIPGTNTIQFDPALFSSGPATITLTYDGADAGTTPDQLLINSNLTIEGPGVDLLTVRGNDVTRVFQVNSGVNATLRGLTISDGYGGDYGGAILNYGGLTLDNASVKSSSANYGGGIYSAGGLTLLDSTVTDNFAPIAGGGVYLAYSYTNITNSTIDHNSGYQGGGIYVNGGTFNLKNSTVSTNSSYSDGGGIAILEDSAYVTLYHNTIAYNSTVGGNGGGVMIGEGQTYNELKHNIIAHNTSTNIGGEVGWGYHGYNLVGNSGTGGLQHGVSGNIVLGSGATAGLAALNNYGGRTRSHMLYDNSVAIDAGDPSAAAGSFGVPVYDQRGVGRILDGNTVPGARIDIGAVEKSKPMLQVDTLDDANDGNFGPGEFSLREAIYFAGLISGADIITFAPQIIGIVPHIMSTIPLEATLLITSDVQIIGPGSGDLGINGGGMHAGFEVASGVTVTISGLTIADGAPKYPTLYGAGIYSQGNLTLNDVTLTRNSLHTALGTLYQAGNGNLVINNSSIIGNSSISGGPGIYRVGTGSLTISNSTISDHVSGSTAGGIYHTAGALTISHSTIARNSGTQGGGIYVATSSPVTIINTTVSGNSATSGGGGIYSNSTNVQISTSTIAENNSGSGFGGGILTASSGGVKLYNSIVAANQRGSASNDVNGTFNSTSSHNLIGNTDGSTNLNASSSLYGTSSSPLDPGLAALDNYGGPTETHALLDDSPAIDGGDSGFNPNSFNPALTTDQRGSGFARVIDGDFNSVARIDIGAFEWNKPKLQVSTNVDELDTDYSAGDFSLREVLLIAEQTAGPDIITFAPNVTGSIVRNSSLGAWEIRADVDLRGPGADVLTINGNGVMSQNVFEVYAGAAGIVIRGLKITGGNGFSGAISSRGNFTLDGVYITGSSGYQSGGLGHTFGNLVIRNSTISGNSSVSGSGGMTIYTTGAVTIVNTTISGNTASGDGGGMRLYGGTTDIINSTITNNQANFGFGGGIYVSGGDVVLHNTIVAGNRKGTAADDVYGNFSAFSSHNLIGAIDGSTGFDFSPTNITGTKTSPQNAGLTSLGNYGGPMPTHALLDGSLAIDAGDDGIAAEFDLLFDQRGEGRVADGDGDLVARVDIGAFELAADEYFGTL